MKRLVIGVLAHVDAGKTTLCEGLLYCAGVIKKLGRVDHGDAFLDTDTQERARGITIFSKQATLSLPDAEFTLLDTPGHVDFSPEMERTLQVLDYAILVISGTDGVQSHTETLWRLLERYQIPTFIFVGKMDLPNAERTELMSQLQSRLHENCVDVSEGLTNPVLERLAMCRESLLDEYLESGKIQQAHICAAVSQRTVFPCCFGSALKLSGVAEFLDQLAQLTQAPAISETFGAQVFKIARDSQGNRLTYLKITGGSLAVRTALTGTSGDGTPWTEKITDLRIYSGEKFTSIPLVLQGTVCAVTGLSHTFPGMGLGNRATGTPSVLQPVMTYRVELPEGCDAHTALSHFRQLEEEEPQLHIVWNETLQELRVQLMGEVQLEILRELVKNRFQIDVQFSKGSIIYQETIANTVEGVGHFEPLRHYAEVHLLLEPGARGSGLVFAADCREDELDRNWQRLILTHLAKKTHLGVLTGAPITDMKITLMAGRAHLKHSEGGDFREATYRAVRQGLMQAESVLLEPWYAYRLEVPMEAVGRAMNDLERIHGTFSLEESAGGITVLTGSAPVSEMQDYQLEVAGYTHGRGRFSCRFDGYAPCHDQEAVVSFLQYRPEADLENTPDSVFCSHGTGTIVKWDRVKEHMHLPSCLSPAPKETPEERSWAQRAAEYCAVVATDKKLMEIFERTYGPIKRDIHTALQTPKSPDTVNKKQRPSPPPAGPEYLLVDGYNIIFAWDDLKKLAQDDLESARQQLIHRLCNYQGVRQCELILVFDAYRVKGNPGSVERIGNISVVYTKEAETADMYIERVTHQIGTKKRVRVATSDGLIQMIILGHGALRISADGFRQEVDAAEQAVREFLSKQND